MEISKLLIAVGAAIFMLPITWVWARQNNMQTQLKEMYNKEETEKLIDLKQKPMQDSLDRNTKAVEEMTKLLTEVRLELAGARSHGKDNSRS